MRVEDLLIGSARSSPDPKPDILN